MKLDLNAFAVKLPPPERGRVGVGVGFDVKHKEPRASAKHVTPSRRAKRKSASERADLPLSGGGGIPL